MGLLSTKSLATRTKEVFASFSKMKEELIAINKESETDRGIKNAEITKLQGDVANSLALEAGNEASIAQLDKIINPVKEN